MARLTNAMRSVFGRQNEACSQMVSLVRNSAVPELTDCGKHAISGELMRAADRLAATSNEVAQFLTAEITKKGKR